MSTSSGLSRSALAVLALLVLAPAGFAQRGAPAPVSPEIRTGSMTLRLRAPSAESVRVTSGGDIPGLPGSGLEMTRNAEGVWEAVFDPIPAGAYRYNFNVDGVATLDPGNPRVSESNANAWSLAYVPGSDFMDTADVPHGAVAEVHYRSSVLDTTRRMHVYTPPGYETSNDSYPVFYLLHGAGDSDDAWSSVGRAGFILDNLIEARQAVPMIVVMPHGHLPASSPQGAEFPEEFATDIKPYIESHYRIRDDRANTALAGLSMGGGHTLDIGMSDLDEYAWLGVFSSGVFGNMDSWETRHEATLGDEDLREGLELLWFSTGSEDFLLDTTESTVDMLRGHGFDVVYEESEGGHTWINWREYLNEFVPLLFR